MPSLRFAAFPAIVAGVAVLLALLARPVAAEPIRVVASIQPLYALALAVGDGLADVDVLVDASRSPHTMSLKPSDARKLHRADVVLWFGPGLETALVGPIAEVPAGAARLEVLALAGLTRRAADEGDGHDAHDSQDGHADHGSADPHVWLNTENARLVVDALAETFARSDPANAAQYQQNAKLAKNRIRLLAKKMHAYLAPVKDIPFVVQHDGLGYLVDEFNLRQAGFIATMAGREPGAAHVREVLATMAEHKVRCLFVEPQFPGTLARRLAADGGVRVGTLDPLGVGLEPGPTLYMRLMQQLARELVDCLLPRKAEPAEAG